jgi:orotate phosphoribosyltransferase
LSIIKRVKIGGKIITMENQAIENLKKDLFSLLEKEALKKGNFVLSSGKTSNYYLDGRVITLTPEGAYLVASIILEMIKGKDIDAIGGPTLGADPIVGAVAAISHIKKVPIKTFIVRKAVKEHGTGRQIEGPALSKGSRVILIDDVATTGKALIEAKIALQGLGVEIEKALVIVDRNEGALENLSKVGLKLESIFQIKDFGL